MARPRHRRVSRIILVDDAQRILLLKTASPNLRNPEPRWITPGGGVEDHESHTEGAIRELFEETGLRVTDVGAPIWTMSSSRVLADNVEQTTYSEFFLVRTASFEPVTHHWMPYEFDDIHDVRWWTLDELSVTDEPYGPLNLVELFRGVLDRPTENTPNGG